jgi:hypothetical protein
MNREEALKKSDEALNELTEALKQGKSDKLLEYLGMLSRFHQYSFCNCMLIYMQQPDASLVACFNMWKDMNRFVKKGEKGISILAPLVGKRKQGQTTADAMVTQASDNDGESNGKVLYGFRVVYVFDVSQTEGQELPEFASLAGDPGDKIDRLEAIIRGKGIELEFANELPMNANGMSQAGQAKDCQADWPNEAKEFC